jgi:hypothetical protein
MIPLEMEAIAGIDPGRAKVALGFDKDSWPNMAGKAWAAEKRSFHDTKPLD